MIWEFFQERDINFTSGSFHMFPRGISMMGNAIGFPLCVGLGMVTGAIVAYVQDSWWQLHRIKGKHVGLLDMMTYGDHTFEESQFATFLVTSFQASSVAFLNSNNLDRIQRANWLSLFQASWNQFTCEFDENFLSWISTYNLSTPQKIVHLKFPWGQSNDTGKSWMIWHRTLVGALFARCHCGADGHLYRWLPFLSQGKRGLKQKLNWLSCFEVLFSLQFSNKYKCVTFIISALLCNQNLFENKNFIQTTFHPSQKTSNDIKNNKTDNIIFNITL